MPFRPKDLACVYVALVYALIFGLFTLLLIDRNISVCEGQYNTTTLLIALGSLFGLALYACLTWKIARATELNTEINRTTLSDIFPAFSFRAGDIYSDRGRWLTFADELRDVWHDQWQLVLYIHNARPVSGYFRLDFWFGSIGSVFKGLGYNVFSEDIFYEPDKRGYSIQANEALGVTATVDKELFLKWLDTCYPEVHKLDTLAHKVRAIIGGGPEPFVEPLDMRMYVRMRLSGYSNPAQKKAPYEFTKTFYLRFNEYNPGTWELIGAPVHKAFDKP